MTAGEGSLLHGAVLVEEALRSVTQLSVIVVDRDMVIQAVHGAATTRHGYFAERMIGRRAPDVVSAAAWLDLGPLYTRALTGETVTTRLAVADGSATYETTFRPVHREGRLIGATATSREVSDEAELERLRRRADGLDPRVFEDAPVGMLIVRGGVVQRANSAMGEILGFDHEHLEGRAVVDLVHPDERVASAEAVRLTSAGQTPPPTDRRLMRPDGGECLVEIRYSVLPEDGGPPTVLLHLVDRTAERRAEEDHQAALALFESTFTRAPIGLCLVAPDGRLLRVNDALCRLLGRDAEDLLARDFQQLTHPEDLAADLELLADTLAGRRDAYELEKRYLRPGGTTVRARLAVSLVRRADGAPAFFVSQLVDLTQLKELQEQLAETQARTQAILDHTPLSVFMRDLDGRWLTVNRRLAAILGHTAEQLEGQDMTLTHDDAQRQQFAADDLAILSDGQPREFDVTFADASRGGERRHYWLQKFAVMDQEGQTIGLGGVSLDVTDREREQRELLAARERFAVAFEHAPVGKVISHLTPGGTGSQVVRCNPAFAQMLGYRPEDLVGQAGVMLTHPDDRDKRDRLILDARAGLRARGEIRLRHRDGHFVWALIAPAMITDADGCEEMIIQAVDITERRRFEEQLRHLADHDALTGLLGRRRFSEELAREAARVRRHGGRASLLLLDLDGFKYVNDAFGHSVGDDLLVRIAAALRHTLRESDVLGRIGGDEFAIVLPETDQEGARTVGAKLGDVVRKHGRVVRDGKHAEVTASIGATALTGTGAYDAEALLVEADVAMYEAKDSGKDRTVSYQRGSRRREHVVRYADWIGRMRTAIRENQFVLHAQPIVPLSPTARRGEHYELLLRLRDGAKLIPPGAFLYHAERDGMIVDIDRWVLSEAIVLLHDARAQGRELALSINLSGRSVQDPAVTDELTRILADARLPRGALTIEITETAAITNVTAVADLARRLRTLGCRLALDDFGAGFASFYYLKHLVFDTLKIDGEFIERLPASPTDQLIVRAVLDVARGLGATVVAERVNDHATVTLLHGLGVDYGQGYHLGRPAPLPAGPRAER